MHRTVSKEVEIDPMNAPSRTVFFDRSKSNGIGRDEQSKPEQNDKNEKSIIKQPQNFPKSLEKYASSKYIDNLIDIRDIDEVSYLDKIASNADQFYALEQEKTYPLNTQADVEKAAEYFDVYEDKFPLAKKYEFALNTKKAVEQGVFGAPTFIIDNELIFGQDRLNFIKLALKL